MRGGSRLAAALFAFYWMVTSSLKPQTDLLASPSG